MFKVISPMEARDGGKWWMRCGTAFANKDDSINVYLNALPLQLKDGQVTLQIRELTEEELRSRDDKRTNNSRPALGAGGSASQMVQDSIPF
jgi:hypothetical protein